MTTVSNGMWEGWWKGACTHKNRNAVFTPIWADGTFNCPSLIHLCFHYLFKKINFQLFKYASLNTAMAQLSDTLHWCAGELARYTAMFFIIFLAFAQMGYVIFGPSLQNFSTFADTVLVFIFLSFLLNVHCFISAMLIRFHIFICVCLYESSKQCLKSVHCYYATELAVHFIISLSFNKVHCWFTLHALPVHWPLNIGLHCTF